MLDRSRVALRNYAEGMRFSTYPAFDPAGPALLRATGWQDAFSACRLRMAGPDRLHPWPRS